MTLMSYDFSHASFTPLDRDGLLPAGDYELDFQRLRESFLVTGAGGKSPTRDAAWREFLVNNLQIMTEQLWNVGVTDVFADGSLVEKDHPNDIDGYFVCSLQALASGELARKVELARSS